MDVTSPTSSPTPAQTVPPGSGEGRGAALNSDFETFLKMLTVQMRNQDPLNPVESADFAVQLATFSSVEQQVRTNDLLGSLGDRLGAVGMGQLLGWVGMTARAEMPVIFDGAPVDMTVRTEPGATEARLVVKDRLGAIVQTTAAPVQGGDIQWDGVGEDGQTLPDGTYSIVVESYGGETLLGTQPVIQTARIIEARNDASGTLLVMETGQEVQSGQILGLRESP